MIRKITLMKTKRSDSLEDEIIHCNIDIISSCNLSCPTCAVGNMESIPGGVMDLEKFRKIVIKLKKEYPYLARICLFNWTEPFLNSKLAQFVEIVKQAGFECYLSTNLNHSRNLEKVIEKNPDHLRISVSGFNQSVYEKGHRDGNVENVKKNMMQISNLIRKYNSSTKVTVFYLKYNYNLNDISPMKEFALKLGFNFDEFWAYLTPVEKVLDYLDSSKKLNPDIIDIIKELGFEPKSYLESLKSFPMQDCSYLKNQIILNSEGFVQLCCATYSPTLSIGNYLEMTPQEIKEKRNNSDMCKDCMKNRIHMYYGSKWDENDLTLRDSNFELNSINK